MRPRFLYTNVASHEHETHNLIWYVLCLHSNYRVWICEHLPKNDYSATDRRACRNAPYPRHKLPILQTKAEENHNGRLCDDEADVSGTEKKEYDQGHIIADALGGVSNAYNITPENSYLNRKGSKYNLEQEWINALRNNQKITNVKVEIIYPNNYTLTPSKYKYSWEVDGSKRSLEIDNIA